MRPLRTFRDKGRCLRQLSVDRNVLYHAADLTVEVSLQGALDFVQFPADQQKKALRKLTIRSGSGVPLINKSTLVADDIYSVNMSLPHSNPKALNLQALSGKRSNQEGG
jgi:hypothetical protein